MYLFWGGEAEVMSGLSISYQRNLFHAVQVFSFDWGINVSIWKSNLDQEKFYTLSIFPVLRFTFFRSNPADFYLFYSVAGPTYISKTKMDLKHMGSHFTFQDNMGLGTYFGKQRNYNTEIRIGHYSNGNIYPENASVKIPLTINVGYSF